MTEEITFNPCPVCGAEADMENLANDDGLWFVLCDGCGARTAYMYMAENAIAAWNSGVVDG